MRRLYPLMALVCVCVMAVSAVGCHHGARRRAAHERMIQERVAQDEAAIKTASAEWSKAAQAKDLDKAISFYADDAMILPPKAPLVQGKDNIRKGWAQMLALPGPGLTITTSGVEVARSGDLAWEHGTYEFATTDKKGKTTTERGKYLTIWKKQADGSWKAIADMQNSDS